MSQLIFCKRWRTSNCVRLPIWNRDLQQLEQRHLLKTIFMIIHSKKVIVFHLWEFHSCFCCCLDIALITCDDKKLPHNSLNFVCLQFKQGLKKDCYSLMTKILRQIFFPSFALAFVALLTFANFTLKESEGKFTIQSQYGPGATYNLRLNWIKISGL